MPDSGRSKSAVAPAVVLSVNGVSVSVIPGSTVAAAVCIAGAPTRTSVTGQPRAPLCGMGICLECRVTIDGTPHRRSCQILCAPGMDVRTA
ncbi:MAG TPA: (2Fe-2S)-binding protein [Acidobacteriaceae bacterium]|jgi:sarcosine oxidase subunit alpha|nr:(2Fe-2S)-binding protein [Acidobacteriaceae bacterium]